MTPASRTTVRLLAQSVRGRRRTVAGLVAWSFVQAAPTYLSGRLVAQAMDDGFLAGRASRGFTWLGLLAVSFVVGALGTRQTYLRLGALVEPFRDELARLTVDGALRRSTRPGAGGDTAAVARLTQHVEIAREAYASVLMVVQGFVVGAVSALLGLLDLVPAALVLVLPPLVAGLALFAVSLPSLAARQRASILADERVAETATALAGGFRDVVACGGESTMEAAVSEHVEAQAQATRDLARMTAVRTLAVAVGGWLPVLLVLFFGPWLLRRGATTGTVLGVLTYLLEGVHPALQTLVRELGGSGVWLQVSLNRIAGTLEAPGPPGARTPPPGPGATPAGYELRLSDVTFRYGPWAEPVVSHLDLAVPEGDHLAVIGPSGVGKSTLANLLTGVLEPDGGEVRLGGVPLADVDAATLARSRVLIPQEAYLFPASLRDNLAYLRAGVTTAELDHAVDVLGARPLVERLGGYDAELAPERLSGGERQLVTLVRAYVSAAPVVVLDEATCHLDPAGEGRVEDAFARRPGTLVVVAHRITSAQRARRVLVMDGTGTVAGTHEELLDRSALYRDLVGHWSAGAAPVDLARRVLGGTVARLRGRQRWRRPDPAGQRG